MRMALLISIGAMWLGALVPVMAASSEGVVQTEATNRLIYVIPVEQTIESGLYRFMQRGFEEAASYDAAAIILRVNTLGGRVDAAEDIGKLVRMSPVPTIAFIEGNAISAGSYISLNANQIIMSPGSSIGAAAVVDGAGNKIEDSKTIAYWESRMRSAAELNGRNGRYAAGMVDDQLVVEVKEIGKTYEKGELISFTSDEALQAGYAEAKANDLNEVISMLDIPDPSIVQFEPTFAERLARFLTSPVVSSLLLLIGLGGVAIELFAPGFGLPGILGISGFALYFFGNYVAGFAGVEHFILFVAGIILLVIEIFVPSFGILGISGLVSLSLGVILAAYDSKQAMLSLGIAILGAVVILAIMVKYFGHRGVWKKFILKDEFRTEEGYVSTAPKQHLLGKTGTALTTLRPSGTALIEEQRIDVVTMGEYISAGRPIEVVQVEGVRVVVREVITQEST